MPQFKKMRIGTLAMVLLLALAMVGVGYGLWSKTLHINGVVNTGNVDAELSIEAIVEDEDVEMPSQQDGADPDSTLEGKDVGKCSAVLAEKNQPKDTLEITIDNGYPSFDCWVTFDVHSTGSIPVHVRRPVFGPIPPAIKMDLFDCYPDGYQLHTSEKALCTIWMHVEQGAGQGQTYKFDGTILVHQFNEEPPK